MATSSDTAFVLSQRTAWSADAIEWEELPSLADSLAQRLVKLGERHDPAARPAPPAGWPETMPAGLEPPLRSEPFTEALEGLATREVNEPDVFRHFFESGDAGPAGIRRS